MFLIINDNKYKTFNTTIEAAVYLSTIGDSKWQAQVLERDGNEFFLSDMDLIVKVLASKIEWIER